MKSFSECKNNIILSFSLSLCMFICVCVCVYIYRQIYHYKKSHITRAIEYKLKGNNAINSEFDLT